MRTHATYTRDAALRKLARINRWMIAGSVALTGALAEVAAETFPGKAKASTSRATKHRTANPPSGSTPTPTTQLAPPVNAPSSTTEAAPSRESDPAAEPNPQSAPTQESAPAEQSTPQESTHESTPAPAGETAPAQESAPPVVSGGS